MNVKVSKLRLILFAAVLSACTACALAASPRGIIRQGNALYYQKQYDAALEQYENEALPEPEHPIVLYNQGNTRHQLKQYDEAIALYEKAAGKTEDPELAAAARFNMGNSLYEQAQELGQTQPDEALKKLNQSLGAYRQALPHLSNPDDAKHNIAVNRELAKQLIELMKQQPPQELPQNKQGDQDQSEDPQNSSANEQESASQDPQQDDQSNDTQNARQEEQDVGHQEQQESSSQRQQAAEEEKEQASQEEQREEQAGLEEDQPLSEKDKKYNAEQILNNELQRKQQEQRNARFRSSPVDKDW